MFKKFATKAEKNINSFLFLYGGDQLNLDLTFDTQATSLDKENHEMKVLAYGNYGKESDGLVCPKCGEKIHLNTEKIDEIISNYSNIKDTVDGLKNNIDNLIKNSVMKAVNNQLKIINITLNSINEDIKKNN